MPDTKISAFATLTHTTIAGADYFPVVQAAGPTNKRITLAELQQTPLTADLNAAGFAINSAKNLLTSSACIVAHQDGTVTNYPAASNTDAAAGTAIASAVAAAVSGDTIYVYRSTLIPNSLFTIAKNGVNWWIASGVVLTASGANDLFSDGDVGPKSYTVSGGGILQCNTGNAVFTSDPNSVVNIECSGITQLQSGAAAVQGLAGSLYVNVNGLIKGVNIGVWWTDGNMYVRAQRIEVTGNIGGGAFVFAVYATSVQTPVGQFWVDCPHIKGQFPIYVWNQASNSAGTPRVWIITTLVEATAANNSNIAPITITGKIYCYVIFEKISITGDRNNAHALTVSEGAIAYLKGQKITPNTDATHATSCINVADSTSYGTRAYIDIDEIDDSAGAISATGGAILVSGGTAFVNGFSLALANAADGAKVTGGTLNLSGYSISTQGGNKDLIQTGGTLNVWPTVDYSSTKTTGTISPELPYGVDQQANTVGLGTVLSNFGFRASGGTPYADWTPAGSATQTANTGLRGPASGAAATPTFRADVIADSPLSTCANVSGTSYTMDGTINNVFLSNVGARTITLSASPSVYKGQPFKVKDTGNTSSGITITPNSGTIEGGASYNFTTALGARTIISDGTNWWVV